MASPAPPAYYESSRENGDQIEVEFREVEEEEDGRESGEWVGADHPKLQVQTNFHRWSEIEDRKDATLFSPNTANAADTRSMSPSTYAPEVRPWTPSCCAPEVVTVMRDEKMEVQEEKIYSPEEKIARLFSTDDKILSPVINGDVDEEGEKVQHGAGKPRPRAICGLPLRRFYTLVATAFAILVVIVVAISVSVSKRNSRKQAARARLDTVPPLKNPSMAALSWKDQRGIDHYKVYYQDESNAILESAWNSTQTQANWKHAVVADTTMNVQPGSPLGAAAGWPHANYSYTLVSVSNRK